MTTDNEIQPASARALGTAVRKTLKKLALDLKCSVKTVDFGGFGYGAMPFATIQTTRKLNPTECKTLADAIRELRSAENGGKGIIKLKGQDYPFGGSIGHQDHLEEAGTNPINNPE